MYKLADKEKFFYKNKVEMYADLNIYKLNAENNSEVMDFLNNSIIAEKNLSDESDVLLPINSIKFTLQEELKNKDDICYYYIKHDNKIIGISQIKINPLLPNKALLANIYIAMEFRGKGFGKRLLLTSMDKLNYKYYYNCHENNANSLNTAIASAFQKGGIISVIYKKIIVTWLNVTSSSEVTFLKVCKSHTFSIIFKTSCAQYIRT